MHNPEDTRQPLLILYIDGSIETPGAQTYGELLARLGICEQLAIRVKQQLFGTPLPIAPDTQELT